MHTTNILETLDCKSKSPAQYELAFGEKTFNSCPVFTQSDR